jgi:hypothetical protein
MLQNALFAEHVRNLYQISRKREMDTKGLEANKKDV